MDEGGSRGCREVTGLELKISDQVQFIKNRTYREVRLLRIKTKN